MKIMASSPIISCQIDGETWKQWQTFFSWAPKSLHLVTAAMKLKDACSLEESVDQPRQRRYFVYKVHLVKAMVFPVVMYGYESWTIKKTEHQKINSFELWCWRRLLRVHWAPVLWPPDSKSWLIWKDPDAGKDWRWEENGMTEDEMFGWYHWLNGHEFG